MTDTVNPAIGAEDGSIFSSGRPGRGRRIMATVVGVVIGVAIVGQVSNQTRGARGPASSSYATSAGGLAALVSLLEQNEIPTARLTKPIDEAWTGGTLGRRDVLVVLDQDLSQSEIASLVEFTQGTSRMIAGGRSTGSWLAELVGSNLESSPPEGFALRTVPGETGTASVFAPDSDVRYGVAASGAAPMVFAGTVPGAIGFDKNGQPVEIAAGSVTAFSDSTIFANAQLARRDNAAFALALLQPEAGGRVVFAEAGHGFRSGRGAGLAAVPSPVRTMMAGLVLAAVAWMFAVGKRIGVPDLTSRPLAPSRFDHVEAVAAIASRARKPIHMHTDDMHTDDMHTDHQTTSSNEGF